MNVTSVCNACNGRDTSQPLATMRSPRVPSVVWPVAICTSCGFVAVEPKPDAETYGAVNDEWFNTAYGHAADEEMQRRQGENRANALWSRIQSSFPGGIGSVLDIGAGRGWSFQELRKHYPDIRAAAIERTPEVRERLENSENIEIIASDVDEDWADKVKGGGGYELVIFRHTLEHMLDPVGTLEKIASALSPEGYAYIVVPNALRVRPGAPMRTDFFRPIHLSYFNRTTLMKLAARAGLVPDVLGEEGEIWGLFRRAESGPGKADLGPDVTVDEQRDHLQERIAEAAAHDKRVIRRLTLKKMVPAGLLSILRLLRGRQHQ